MCLDAVRGLVVLMAPSHLHDDLSETFDDVVDAAAARASKRLGSARLRAPHEPPGTGMEPDCGFCLDERAEAYRAAVVEGEAAAEAFFERTPLDLVVEVEITHADAGKIERYGDIGVRELWRLHGRKGTQRLSSDDLVHAERLAGRAPDQIDAAVAFAAQFMLHPAYARPARNSAPPYDLDVVDEAVVSAVAQPSLARRPARHRCQGESQPDSAARPAHRAANRRGTKNMW